MYIAMDKTEVKLEDQMMLTTAKQTRISEQ